MLATIVVCNSSLIVKGCVIRAWSALVRRTCDKCPDQCAYRNAKIEWHVCEGGCREKDKVLREMRKEPHGN